MFTAECVLKIIAFGIKVIIKYSFKSKVDLIEFNWKLLELFSRFLEYIWLDNCHWKYYWCDCFRNKCKKNSSTFCFWKSFKFLKQDGGTTAKIKNEIISPYAYAYIGVSGEKPVNNIKLKKFNIIKILKIFYFLKSLKVFNNKLGIFTSV